MSIELPFNPFPLFRGSHQQTIIGSVLYWPSNLDSTIRHVELKDKDKLAIEVSTPKKWKNNLPTIVMIHGLCGSHKSTYLIRIGKKLNKKNIRVVRINLRGCGSGRGLARKAYHGGQSDDIFSVIKLLKEEAPDSPIILIGFSLGGNIVMKLAGELKNEAKNYLKMVMAINSPLNLYPCVKRMGLPDNQFYEKYFTKLMKEDLYYRQSIFPDIPQVILPEEMTMMEFDELYTAPNFGFFNALDYYSKCSSYKLIPEITIPAKIMFAKDDPIIETCTFEGVTLPKDIQVYTTNKGGHMGYLGIPGFGGFHWLDKILINWIHEGLS